MHWLAATMLAPRTAAICALALAASAALAGPFECAPLQPSAARAPAYGPAANPGHCEGFFEKTVSQPFIELLSLTRANSPELPSGPLSLKAGAGKPLRIVVQPLRSRPTYRADLQLDPGAVRRWDPSAMLAATGLRAPDLGFLATADAATPSASSGEPAAFVPVEVLPAAATSATALAVLRVSVPVASVSWRSYRIGGAGEPAPPWTALPGSRLLQWQRIALPIALPPDGRTLRVDIEAVDAQDGRALPQLHFLVLGSQ